MADDNIIEPIKPEMPKPEQIEPNETPPPPEQIPPSSPPNKFSPSQGECPEGEGFDERDTAVPTATEIPLRSAPPPLQKEEYKVIGIEPNNPIVKPVLGFLDKLKELRVRANQTRTEHKDNNLENILAYARAHGRITNDEAEKICGVKDDRATEYLNILVEKGQLIRLGKTKNTFYKPT